jgi:hypothetical protein
MNGKRVLHTATTVFGVLSILCLGGYFLALNDIADDYVSPQIAEANGLALPSWTACSSEWSTLNLGLIPILGFHMLAICCLLRREG